MNLDRFPGHLCQSAYAPAQGVGKGKLFKDASGGHENDAWTEALAGTQWF
jgi:hypothetical protein